MSENGTELTAAKKRIADLELAVKMLKQANVNMLTVIKQYGLAISDIVEKVMGQKEAEEAVGDLKKRHGLGGG